MQKQAMPTDFDVQEFMRLKAENERLKAQAQQAAPPITAKVAKSGGISLYGMGKFPVTLYPEQWAKVFTPEVKAKIDALVALPKDEFERLQAVAAAKAAANPF